MAWHIDNAYRHGTPRLTVADIHVSESTSRRCRLMALLIIPILVVNGDVCQ
jgi:hypothetical protein